MTPATMTPATMTPATMTSAIVTSATVRRLAWLAGGLLLAACATGGKQRAPAPAHVAQAPPTAQQQVFAAETAFAKSLEDRDFSAFVRFLSHDAVFFSNSGVERGVTQIAEAWQPLFKDKVAPFSWAPDAVEVVASGDLAWSTGVVVVNGNVVGRFNSVWRREGPKTWRIVFDKGERIFAP
jgi:ketosteroid isomerase-like protein